MPKSPKISRTENLRHNPLAEDYSPYALKQKAPEKRKASHDDDAETEHVVDARSSRKILNAAQDLADEEEGERKSRFVSGKNEAFAFDERLALQPEEEEDPEGPEEEQWHDEGDQDLDIEETDPNDLDVFNRFNPPAFDDPILHMGSDRAENQTRNLADIILAKIAQHEAGQATDEQLDDMEEDEIAELSPKAVEVYTKFVCLGAMGLELANQH
jgi:essential nuclear protein 1